MPTQSAITLVDALAQEANGVAAPAVDDALRSQAAFVRALVDEIGRHHPSDRRMTDLHEQLAEELARLAALAEEDSPTADGAVSGQPLDVLVVDDDYGMLEAQCAVVRDLGYPCRGAASGQDALREYERRPAAIVLSDWHMPGMTGLELCAALKRLDTHPYVILVTAHESTELPEDVRGAVDDFLPKPIDVDQLSGRLRAAERLVRAVRVLESVKGRLPKAPGH
jgi:CheY-like chemotaxis protein